MKAYSFAVRDSDTEAEKIGLVSLPNDDEALDFVRHIIQDLVELGGAEDYADCTIDVIEGDRTVSSIRVA